MTYLISTTENYRVDTEDEVKEILEQAKNDGSFTLAKYSSTFKEKKAKGEILDSWYRVSLTKVFTDEKEPEVQVVPSYTISGGYSSAF